MCRGEPWAGLRRGGGNQDGKWYSMNGKGDKFIQIGLSIGISKQLKSVWEKYRSR